MRETNAWYVTVTSEVSTILACCTDYRHIHKTGVTICYIQLGESTSTLFAEGTRTVSQTTKDTLPFTLSHTSYYLPLLIISLCTHPQTATV